MRETSSRHLVFLHSFQQRRLRLRRGPIDFVGQQNVGKDGSRNEPHCSVSGTVFFQHFCAGDVGGHQVRRKLNAVEFQIEQPSDRIHKQRLGQTRSPRNQTMPAGQQRNQQLLDNILLADNDLGQFTVDLFTKTAELRDQFTFAFRCEIRGYGFEFRFGHSVSAFCFNRLAAS